MHSRTDLSQCVGTFNEIVGDLPALHKPPAALEGDPGEPACYDGNDGLGD